MYQEWMSLIDLVEEDAANKLNEIAAKDGWREVQPKEALDMGFRRVGELVKARNRCSCAGRRRLSRMPE